MLGLLYRIAFTWLHEQGGPDALGEVMQRVGIAPERVFRMNEMYSDEEWRHIFAASCEVLGLSTRQAERSFAGSFIRDAERRFPRFFQMSQSSREFLERQPTIHNSFATGLVDREAREQVNDKFRIESLPDRIITHYRSQNRLCGVYIALAELVIDRYGDMAAIQEPRCMRRGDEHCEIVVQWFETGGAT